MIRISDFGFRISELPSTLPCHSDRASGASEWRNPWGVEKRTGWFLHRLVLSEAEGRVEWIPRSACGFAFGYAVTSRSLGMTHVGRRPSVPCHSDRGRPALCHSDRASGASEWRNPWVSQKGADWSLHRLVLSEAEGRVEWIPRFACGFAFGYAVTSRSLGMTPTGTVLFFVVSI